MYVPNFDLEDMKELRVTVVPRDVELFPHDRAHNKYHCRVDVAVQKKFSKGTMRRSIRWLILWKRSLTSFA